jgi:stage V sporulation protein SpoVS
MHVAILIAVLLAFMLGANVFANTGKAITTNRLLGGGSIPYYIGWGTGAGTAAATDTTLFTEAAESRVQGTASQQTVNVTNDTFQVVGTMTVAGAGKTITNAGLFDASSGGNLFVKGDFTGVSLNVGESIAFTFKLTYA